jgi:hypothetical protein
MLPDAIELLSVALTNSCPANSSNVLGRRRVAVTSNAMPHHTPFFPLPKGGALDSLTFLARTL